MRGYGKTDAPPEIDRYTLLHHVGDMLGLLDALGIERAVIAGHDWGAPLAWLAVQLRPDRFHGVIGLSGPFGARAPRRPTEIMPQDANKQFYQLYFQTSGLAEAEFEEDVRSTIRAMLYSASGDAPDLAGSVADRDAPGRRFPHQDGEPRIAPALGVRNRCRFLCFRIRAHRISGRSQLLP